jgi:hypothetical protein
MKPRSMVLTATVVAALGAGAAHAECFNEYETLPGYSPTVFVIILKGNVIGSLNIGAMATDPTVNPFYYVIKNDGAKGTANVTAALNGQGNTVVTFTGPAITPGETNSPGHPPHFGLDPSGANGSGPKLTVVTQYWSNNKSSTQLPSLTVNAPTLGAGTTKWITFFADVTANGQTVGQWFEVPYTGTQPTFSPQVYTQGNVTLSNVGYQLSPTFIPLDNLNFPADPPPNTSGSTFTDLPQFDGKTLTSMPEPGSAVLAVGLTGLLLQRFRRRRRA